MNRRYRILLPAFLIAVLIVFLSYSMVFSDDGEKTYKVSILLEGSDDDRWTVVKAGMQKAAKDNNLQLNYVAMNQYISINDQWDLIDQEIKSGTDAIVFQPVGSDGMADKLDGVTIPVVLVDGDIYPEGVYTTVHADDREIGKLIARTLYEDYGNSLKDMKIGLVTSAWIHKTMTERANGFLEEMNSYGIQPAWKMGLGLSLSKALDRQLDNTATDIIVCMGNLETGIAVDSVLDANQDIVIYGQGYSEKNVYYLDKGLIQCLVLSNEYYMGYRSVELAAQELHHDRSEDADEEEDLELYCVHSADLYNEENQKIMFPLVQ